MAIGKHYIKFLIILLTLFPTHLPAAAKTVPENRIIQNWNTTSGLPHNSILSVAQTSDGYLWLGTPAGLVRFDGVRFIVYNKWNTPILGNNRILSLYEDGNKVLWVGTDGEGLYLYKNGKWKCFEKQKDFMNKHISALIGDNAGNIWIGTEYNLHCFKGEDTQSYGLAEGLADNLITSLVSDTRGNLWAGTLRGGFAKLKNGIVTIYDFNDGLTNLSVLSLAAGSAGNVWIGTMEGLFNLCPEENIISSITDLSHYPITSLLPLPNDRLLVGTMVEGLKILDNSSITNILPNGEIHNSSKTDISPGGEDGNSSLTDILPNGEFSNSHIVSILRGNDGYIWAGTKSRGLAQLKERKAYLLPTDGILSGKSVYALLENKHGTVWAGTEKNGLYSIQNGRITKILNKSQGLAGNMVRALMEDISGRIWVGTMEGGLSILSKNRIRNLTTDNGLNSNNITALLQDNKGAIWVGSDMGLNCYTDKEIVTPEVIHALEGQPVRTLFENMNGTLFAGTRNGIWKSARSSFKKINPPSDKAELDVLSLYEDRSGGLWIGTNGEGLKHISKQKIRSYTTIDGLPGDFIYSITEDDSCILWISCEAGVFSVNRDSLAAYTESTQLLPLTLYNEAEGMPSADCNGFCNPAVYTTRSGKRLYPTKKGIAVFDSERLDKFSNPPVVHIESITADENPLNNENDIILKHKTGRVEIRFTAFDYSAPEKCRFLYRLEGYDSSFTPVYPNKNRTAVYRGLSPGKYKFTVRAIGNSGLWSKNTAAVKFIILPPLYRKKSFIFTVMAFLLLTGGGIASFAKHRKIRKQKMKYQTTTIDAERMGKALRALNTLMEEEKAFLDPDLSLKKLARDLKIHYNHLSRIVNEHFGISFNDYINRYRVNEAKIMLVDPSNKNRNILEISYDAGFYSKSTFNSAFKKFAGTTPSKYRRDHS